MSTLHGARALVTGGAGTIGSTIVDQLLDAGVAHVDVLDNLVRGRPENLATAMPSGRVALIEGDIRDRDLVHDLTRANDLVFHQAAIRITQCAEEPRLALEVLVDGTFNVLEAAAEHDVDKLVAGVVGLGLRARRGVPDPGEAPPLRQRHVLRRGQDVQRGHAAQLPGDVRARLRRPALLQRLRPADGRARPLHRGPRPLDGADRRRPSAAHLRRRRPDDGLRLHRGHRPGQHPRDGLRRARGRLQHRQPARDLPARPGRGAPSGHGLRPRRRARARPRGQRGHPTARRRHRRRAATSAGRRAPTSTTACARSSSGGARSARSSPRAGRALRGRRDPHQRHEAVARCRGGRRRHGGHRVGLGRPGPPGRRVRGRLRRSGCRRPTPSRRPAARRRCTSPSSWPASSPGTTSSSRRSRSSRRPTPSTYVGATPVFADVDPETGQPHRRHASRRP